MLRFAPLPTGDIDISSLQVAIVNFIVAKQKKEPFTIRIKDYEHKENMEGKDTQVMQILEKFALIHHFVFHQSEHLNLHQTLAIKLLNQHKAFICTCTKEEIEKEKQEAKKNNTPYHYSQKCSHLTQEEYEKIKEDKIPFVIRIKKPQHSLIMDDTIQGSKEILAHEIDSFILLNEDKTPSEVFASACDDILSDISYTIEENSTFLQSAKTQYIKEQLAYPKEITSAHLPLLSLVNNQKEYSVTSLFQEGFIPDAILNYLIGMLIQQEDKIFTLPQAIELFDIHSIPNTPTHFDINQLKIINVAHLKRVDDKIFSTLFGFADADIGKLAKLYLDKDISTIKSLTPHIKAIFSPKNFENAWKKEMLLLKEIIQLAPMMHEFHHFKAYLIKESNLEESKLMPPLQLLLTNTTCSPELSDIYPLIKSYLLEIAS